MQYIGADKKGRKDNYMGSSRCKVGNTEKKSVIIFLCLEGIALSI
jgi:hypothetical protein